VADHVAAVIIGDATLAALNVRLLRTDRAAQWTVRQAGRVAKDTARGKAPVATGRLRDSIRSSKALKGGPGNWSVKVAAFGWPASGYSGGEEAKHHFMKAGQTAAEAAMPVIAAEAFGRVWT
jgi:hypothetical protein